MQFQNPNNDYTESVQLPFLWCLMFGTLYFLVKGVWSHAIISLVLAVVTVGISWLLYPFFAKDIMIKSYLKKGWSKLK